MASSLTAPASADAVGALLADARSAGRQITPTGSGTKMSWGGQTAGDADRLPTRGLQHGLHHFAGDLVAVLPAGLTLDEANAALAPAGQWLPLDPSWPERATIGGIVATNDSGPRRHRHGAPRDLIVGIEVVLADGRIARAGGRVVKNVAGYDLSRLFCGSHGSLGVITSATFKLAPIAAASLTASSRLRNVAEAMAFTEALSAAPITPSAIELQMPGCVVLVRFETTRRAAQEMAQSAVAIAQRFGADISLIDGSEEIAVWRAHAGFVWSTPGAVVKAAVLPTSLPRLFDALSASTLEWTSTSRAALGVALFGLRGEPSEVVRGIQALRTAATVGNGHATLLEAADDIRAAVDRWQSPAASVMLAVKERFDPQAIFPPVPHTGAR